MSTETKIKWGSGRLLPDGHRLFFNIDPAREPEHQAAIADDSGRFPEDTDDGILWLDFSRTLEVVSRDQDREAFPEDARHNLPLFESISVPLINSEDKKTRTPSDAATMLHLSREFQWTISVDNTFFYNVR